MNEKKLERTILRIPIFILIDREILWDFFASNKNSKLLDKSKYKAYTTILINPNIGM